MNATPLAIPQVILLAPRVFEDARGFFLESYRESTFCKATGCSPRFVQDNHSCSTQGVLRGLHFQLPPFAQGKLIRVVTGTIMDVAVDVRRRSPTFGQWLAVILSAANKRQLWVPEGFAHGFLTLSDTADVLYKTTAFHAPEQERALIWNDPDIGIDWPADVTPVLSQKDAMAPRLRDAEVCE